MIINSKYYKIPSFELEQLESPQLELVTISNEITESEEVLLEKMLEATGLKTTSRQHIILERSQFPLRHLMGKGQKIKILTFDCAPQQLGLQIRAPRYQPLHVHSAQLVFVDDLDSISKEIPLKKFIWNLFKTWFIER